MAVTYASSRTNGGRAPSTALQPFQPQRDVVDTAPTAWTRPADWAAMPTIVTSDKKIAILYAVWDHGSNFVAMTVNGSAGYTVDWGDGSGPVNVGSGVQANYNYDYATVAGSATSRGYKTVVAVITPQGGGTLTALNTNLRNPANTQAGTGANSASSPMLEIVVCSAALTSWTMGSGTPSVRHGYCEQVTIIDHGSMTSTASLFNNFHSLRSFVVSPTFGTGVTDMSSMFGNCYSLQTVPLFVTTSVTNMNNMFESCNNLLTCPDFNTATVTGMGSMFSSCSSLQAGPAFNMNSLTNAGSMFSSCPSLRYVPFYRMPSVTTISSMFSSCQSLRTVEMSVRPGTGTVAASSAFANCSNLVNPPNFDYINFSNVSAMYQNCASIVRFPNRVFNFGGLASGSGTSMFSGCTSLKEIDTIVGGTSTASGGGVFGTSAFNNCGSLVRIGAITSGLNFNGTFVNCTSLKSLPTIRPTNSTVQAIFSNCQSLRTVTMDFALAGNAWAPFTGAFAACVSLESITFLNLSSFSGSTMQSVFQDCRALREIPAMPSTASISTWTSAFQGCRTLRAAPALIMSGATTCNSMFANCFNLQSTPAYTFPATAGVNISNMFTACYSLESIGTMTFGSGALTTSSAFITAPNLGLVRSSNLKSTTSFANAKLGPAQLNQLYTDLPTVTAQTLTVTGNWGAATDNPAIATAKGWTVTGS